MTMEITRIAENDDRLLLHLQGRLDIAGAGEIETRLYALINGAAPMAAAAPAAGGDKPAGLAK